MQDDVNVIKQNSVINVSLHTCTPLEEFQLRVVLQQ